MSQWNATVSLSTTIVTQLSADVEARHTLSPLSHHISITANMKLYKLSQIDIFWLKNATFSIVWF